MGNAPNKLGEYIASAPLTPLVKPCGGIRPIAVGTVWRRLVSMVSAIMIGHSLDGYFDGLQFGVGVAVGNEAILHSVNRLIEACGDDVGLSMLLVDFKNAFNLVDREVMLREVHLLCPAISRWVEFCYSNLARLDSFSLSLHAWYLDDGTIVGDTMVVGKVLELIIKDGLGCGLHLNVDKTEVFWPKEDPRSRLACIFSPNIARPLHGVKLLGGPASVDFDFCNELVMKRVAKTIGLMDAIAKINDPQCELLLLRSCAGISRLYFTTRTCPPRVFESAQCSFNVALRSSLERISVSLQTKLLWHTGIVSPGPIFDYALSVFNTSMETDLLSNQSETTAPKLMKKMADIYFTWLVQGFLLGIFMETMMYRVSGLLVSKHRHNIVRDTLVDICYRYGISTGKEVEIGLDGGRDKPLRPPDMLLYSLDGGLDVCVDLNGSSHLTQIWMVDFVPGRAVIDAAHRELEADAVTLLKRIRKFSMAQYIRARDAVHIFNRISFAIAKGSIIKDYNRQNKADPIRLDFGTDNILLKEGRVVRGKDVGEEDLSKPFKEKLKTPFTRRIIEFVGPEYVMPTNITLYDGSTDPADHLNRFSMAANSREWPMPVWCRMFQQTLDGGARGWFESLPLNSINEWYQLREAFTTRYSIRRVLR
ncbi:hypothetical protein Tco_0586319 [Tanacetum coccineum]